MTDTEPGNRDGADEKQPFFTASTVAVAAVWIAVVAALGWLALRAVSGDKESGSDVPNAVAAAGGTSSSADAGNSTAPDDTPVPADESDNTSAVQAPAASTTLPPTTASEVTTTVAQTTTTAETTTTVAPTTTQPPPPTTVAPVGPATYEMLPDGSPAPVVAIFDVNVITLSGAVPSQAAADRLSALALANSKTPATVDNRLTINPAVPINVGVRVIELTSARFPEASTEILPEHALELNRVVNVMNALPNVSVLVVGHADQRGDEARNFQLSEDRARAVVNYLTLSGIAPTRLSSRAVGEDDLLTLNNDAAALALNRRTEFIFYGLLIG